MTQTLLGNGNMNLGMHQLISRERERLGVNFVSGYEIWDNEDNSLPGYEGYVHFEIYRGWPLLANDGNATQSCSQAIKNHYRTRPEKEKLVECGFEFTSTMKLAALSIGTAAVYGKPGFSDLTELFPSSETELFWQNVIQAWTSLGMASDRLRTFFILFVRREKERPLDRRLQRVLNKSSIPSEETPQFVYKEAFREYDARDLNSEQHLIELKSLVEDIGEIRSKRNKFVHDYASREAMWVSAQRNKKLDHAKLSMAMSGQISPEDYIQELADAYKVLVRAGNLIFLMEKHIVGD